MLLLCSAAIAFSESTPASPLRVLVSPTTAALPFLQMARDGLPGGMDLKVDFFANHAQALAILLRGEADLLLSGTSQGWENRLDGSPIVMLDTGVWAISSLVGKDPAIRGFADLKGKRLAVPFPGAPLDFQSRALLSFEKIDPDKDVRISYRPVRPERPEAPRRPAGRGRPARASCDPRREEERAPAAGGILQGVGALHGRRPAVPAGQPVRHRGLAPGARRAGRRP